jgi:hypothetical protein
MKTLTCIECGHYWGAVLTRPGDTEADARQAILDQMTVDWNADWRIDREPDWPATPPAMPAPTFRVEQVVHVTEADARWLGANSIADMFVEACWQPVRDTDLPDWFIRARTVRTAVVVDRCCDRTTHPAREHARAVADALTRALTAA